MLLTYLKTKSRISVKKSLKKKLEQPCTDQDDNVVKKVPYLNYEKILHSLLRSAKYINSEKLIQHADSKKV